LIAMVFRWDMGAPGRIEEEHAYGLDSNINVAAMFEISQTSPATAFSAYTRGRDSEQSVMWEHGEVSIRR
jgi:hypothetical protein